MNAAQRRERILTRLNSAGAPLSASTLAAELGGVAADRGRGCGAAARRWGADRCHPPGYQLHPAEKGYTGILACVHSTQEEMRRELYTVVDQGGTVVDVAVENSLYGEIRATLNLCNRYDVDNFIRQAADAPESLFEPHDRRCAPAHPALPGQGHLCPHPRCFGAAGAFVPQE